MTPKPQPPVSASSSAHVSQSNATTSQLQQPQTSRKETTSFWDTYENLCALQNLMPLQSLKTCLSSEAGAVLSLNADKLKSSDWEPIFGALKTNKSLSQISIISNYTNDNESDSTNRLVKGFAKLKKTPSIRNKERINKLCRCLKDCLQISVYLNKLEIYNIPLAAKDLTQIAKGLRANKTLKILSMDRCLIGDEGLAIICKDIQSSNNLNRINFSSCDLTHEGAEILANLIKVQALKRHNEAWKDSLRYGRPDLDSMFGIRRITITSNPNIGDRGVYLLSEAFKSDLWLKALDLQDCGITTTGAKHLLDGLKFNAMMHVLDVRLNLDIDRDMLQKIMEQVMINSNGHSTDYEWMDLKQTAAVSNITAKSKAIASNNQQVKLRLKKRRNTNASFSKKAQFMTATNTLRMKRCKSTGSVVLNKSPNVSTQRQSLHIGGGNTPTNIGIPWRTAARADRYRISSSCAYRKVNPSSSSSSLFKMNDENDDEKYENLIRELNDEDDKEREDDDEEEDQIEFIETDTKHLKHRMRNLTLRDESKLDKHMMKMTANSTFDHEKISSSSLNSKAHKSKNDFASSLDRIKNVSVKDLLNILQREQQSKTQLEDMLIQFQEENTKLKAQISLFKHKLDHQQQEMHLMNETNTKRSHNNNNNNLNRTLLDDDKALEIIELTLYKYQNFLDFLRNAGFGKLIEIGEMDQKQQQKNKQKKYKNSTKKDSAQISAQLTDQQRYYLDKINKTKTKLNNTNIMESTQVSISDKKSSKFMTSQMDIFSDNEGYSIDGIENHHIDTLLPNALEISRSYRRLNSSSVNSSMAFNNTNYTKKRNDMILSNIKENSTNQTETTANASSILNYIDDSTLLENVSIKQPKQAKKTIIEEPIDVNKITNRSADSSQLSKNEIKKSNHSNTSTVSPATTIIANNAPMVSARKTINQLSKSDDIKTESDKKDTSLEDDVDEVKPVIYVTMKNDEHKKTAPMSAIKQIDEGVEEFEEDFDEDDDEELDDEDDDDDDEDEEDNEDNDEN